MKETIRIEPYIEKIRNRSQRQWLSRYRVSAHRLRVETGRYTFPVTPLSDRVCVYCDSNEIDTEHHFILNCGTFNLKRNCFLGRMSALVPHFSNLNENEKLMSILCPSTTEMAKIVSKYLGIMTEVRKNIDNGLSIDSIQSYTKH